MISDCDKRSSIKSLRSASLVSSLFDSATSIIHPLDPGVDIELDSSGTPRTPDCRHSIFDQSQLTHVGRSISSAKSNDLRKSIQDKR